MSTELSPTEIVRLLADGDRLRVVAALVLGAGDLDGVSKATGIERRAAVLAVSRLASLGLVERSDHGLRVAEDRIRAAARGAATTSGSVPDHPLVDAAVLRAFVDGDVLVAIPTARRKLLQVLDLVSQDFEPGQRYSEREVNAILHRRYADVAALRRHLVDEGFLDREGGGGCYWRCGGTTLV